MDKAMFDFVFEKHQAKFQFSVEELIEKMAPYANENGNMTTERLALFAYSEGVKDCQNFIYSLLSELLDVK